MSMADRIEAGGYRRSPVLMSVAGSLRLEAAIIAARSNARSEALARLSAAKRLADELGHDANHGWTAFGPTNVAIHRLAVSTHLGDPGEALRAAETIGLDALPPGLTSRRAQVQLELANARLRRREQADALLHLLAAERVAPQVVRHTVTGRALVQMLLDRQTRSTATAVDGLARRAGLLS